MKKFEVIYNKEKYIIEGLNLIKTLIAFCKENNFNIEQVENCVLIDEEKEFLIRFSNFWEKEYNKEISKKWYQKIFNYN